MKIVVIAKIQQVPWSSGNVIRQDSLLRTEHFRVVTNCPFRAVTLAGLKSHNTWKHERPAGFKRSASKPRAKASSQQGKWVTRKSKSRKSKGSWLTVYFRLVSVGLRRYRMKFIEIHWQRRLHFLFFHFRRTVRIDDVQRLWKNVRSDRCPASAFCFVQGTAPAVCHMPKQVR